MNTLTLRFPVHSVNPNPALKGFNVEFYLSSDATSLIREGYFYADGSLLLSP